MKREHVKAGGFTLTEVAVVVFLIATMLVTILPNLKALAGRNRVIDATRQIQAAEQLARMRAINERKDHVVLFQPNGWNIFVDTDEDGVKDASEKWVYNQTMRLPPAVRYQVPAGNPTGSDQPPEMPNNSCKCTRWAASGLMRNSSPTNGHVVTLGNGKDYRRIDVTVAGAIKFQRWNPGAVKWE